MKNIFKKFSIISLFIVAMGVFATVSNAAEKYNLVLFYADWNVYSNQAINTLSQVAEKSPNISFETINIDDKKAFVRMKQLGVMPTNSIPYYFLMDKNKKVIYGSTYKTESEKIISDTLNKRIGKQN